MATTAEINETEKKNSTKPKSSFLGEWDNNKINKHLARLLKKKAGEVEKLLYQILKMITNVSGIFKR